VIAPATAHHRIAALNLLAAIIIYWNSWKLGEVVARMAEAGQAPALDLLPHVSPLGWEHINLTGEHRWRSLVGLRPLPQMTPG
jgi:hypothetical protein